MVVVVLMRVDGCVVQVRRFGFHLHGASFICVWTIQTSKIYMIIDNNSNQWLSIYRRTGVISILVTIVILNV